jgi:hypothetical protein
VINLLMRNEKIQKDNTLSGMNNIDLIVTWTWAE